MSTKTLFTNKITFIGAWFRTWTHTYRVHSSTITNTNHDDMGLFLKKLQISLGSEDPCSHFPLFLLLGSPNVSDHWVCLPIILLANSWEEGSCHGLCFAVKRLLELWNTRKRKSLEDAGCMGTGADKECGSQHGWRDHIGSTSWLPPQPWALYLCFIGHFLFSREDLWFNATICMVFILGSWHEAPKTFGISWMIRGSALFICAFICLLFFFYWSIVDLQCCANFCSTAKWLSYMHSFLMFFSIMVYPRRLVIVPCAMQ